MQTVSDAVNRISNILYVENVSVVHAHWDYEKGCAGYYAGFEWILREWGKLYNKNEASTEDAIYDICKWKICILGFEPEKHYIDSQDMTKDNKRRGLFEKIRMLLGLDNICYLQTPPAQLETIKEAIGTLSNQPIRFNGAEEKIGRYLGEMNCYAELNEYLHKFGRKDYSELDDFKQYIAGLPQTLKEGMRISSELKEFEKALAESGKENFPKKEYENLYDKVGEEWF